MFTTAREILLDRAVGSVDDSGDFLDGVALHIEKEDRGSFLVGKLVEGGIESLIFERVVGGIIGGEGSGFVTSDGEMFAAFVVDEGVVPYPIYPRVEFGVVLQPVGGEVGFEVRFLGNIVRELGVTTTEGNQKAPERILRSLYV